MNVKHYLPRPAMSDGSNRDEDGKVPKRGEEKVWAKSEELLKDLT